jgi:hypothetical protein
MREASMKRSVTSSVKLGMAVSLCGALLLSGSVLAWGPGGHMIVAQIAYQRLNANAKMQVDTLIALKIEPIAVTQTSLDFVNAAHWPDDLRPVPAFADTLPLHFINVPISADSTTPPKNLPEKVNIVTALQKYVDILKSNAADAQRAQALRFIIHFVGDVHQPLHSSTRISHDHPMGDEGGNEFMIKLATAGGRSETEKLHSYWDGGIGDFPKAGPNFAPPPLSQIGPAVTRVITEFPDSDAAWKAGGPFAYAAWARESTDLARSTAYNGIAPNGEPSKMYNSAALKAVHRRAAWGGYRLAVLLNTIWPAVAAH